MIGYELIRSDRRTLAIQVRGDGQVIVRAPRRTSQAEIQRFVDAKAGWIARQLEKIRQRQARTGSVLSPEELQALADAATQDIPRRVQHYAPLVGVTWGRITIRAQRTRWGSCSGKGNLNFNCLLMLCPEEIRDYVVVHELCHRREMNHSARFWQEVAWVMPDYALRRRWLKENGGAIIRRLGNHG